MIAWKKRFGYIHLIVNSFSDLLQYVRWLMKDPSWWSVTKFRSPQRNVVKSEKVIKYKVLFTHCDHFLDPKMLQFLTNPTKRIISLLP